MRRRLGPGVAETGQFSCGPGCCQWLSFGCGATPPLAMLPRLWSPVWGRLQPLPRRILRGKQWLPLRARLRQKLLAMLRRKLQRELWGRLWCRLWSRLRCRLRCTV